MEIFWIILLVLIAILFIFLKLKHLQHRIFLAVLIILIIFFYFSYTRLFADQNINLNSSEGLRKVGKIYISWLGEIFYKTKSIIGNVIKTDWRTNITLEQTAENLRKISRR